MILHEQTNLCCLFLSCYTTFIINHHLFHSISWLLPNKWTENRILTHRSSIILAVLTSLNHFLNCVSHASLTTVHLTQMKFLSHTGKGPMHSFLYEHSLPSFSDFIWLYLNTDSDELLSGVKLWHILLHIQQWILLSYSNVIV